MTETKVDLMALAFPCVFVALWNFGYINTNYDTLLFLGMLLYLHVHGKLTFLEIKE